MKWLREELSPNADTLLYFDKLASKSKQDL